MRTMSFLELIMCILICGCVVCEAKFIHSEDLPESLDTLILSNKQIPTTIDRESWFWEEYEFENNVKNREELRITDIQIWRDMNLQQNITNWQYLEHNYELYVAAAEKSTLFLYHVDHQNASVTIRAKLSVAETIKSFKIISFSSNNKEFTKIKDSIVVIVSIENENRTQYLKWFYLQDYKFFPFWIWELLKTVKSFKYFDMNENRKLLVLYEKDVYFNQNYSLVEVYDINTSEQFSKQLCCQFLVNEVSDIRICPSQEGSKTFALLDKDHVTLHEYRDILMKCVLKPVKNMTVLNVNNVICFESNNINHFGVSGFVTNFFKFHANEFMYEQDMETLLNEVGDIHFIKELSVNTYRNDVILFVQSKNLTVFALCWQNAKFQFVRLPNSKLDDFDFSKIIVIQNYGFLIGNTFIGIKIELVPLSKLHENGIQNIFRAKSVLEDILNTQEIKFSDIGSGNQSIASDDIKIENFSSSTKIDVENLLVNKTNSFMISMKCNNLTFEKLQINYEESKNFLEELQAQISKIENQVDKIIEVSASDIPFFEEINVTGNIEISGTAVVNNLFTDHLNNMNVDVLSNNRLVGDGKVIGNKTFPSITFFEGNLKMKYLNGIPIEDFQFDEAYSDRMDINIAEIKKLEVKGNLYVSKINDVDWNSLMDQLVFRNQKKVIPGSTKLSGVMVTRFIRVNYLNDFQYPLDYIVKSGPENGDVTGIKTVGILTVTDLKDVKTINGIDADEFIILTADQNLKQQITFENLVIDESVQIDGRIIGLPEQDINPDLTLLNSNNVQSNAIFTNLYIFGKVYVQNLVDGIQWSEIDDLILKTDGNVIVNGVKKFPHNVRILGNLEIKSSILNEHPTNTFITLDTRQILPSLSKITGNIRFSRITYEELENIEDKLRIDVDDLSEPKCFMKPLVFLEAPIVDEFSSTLINNNITGIEFSEKLDILSNDINFVDLKCKKLIVSKLKSSTVNSINIRKLVDEKITKSNYQELSGMIKLNNLETQKLHTGYVNNRSHEQLNNTAWKINSLYTGFVDSEIPMYLLNTTKFIATSKISGKNLRDILDLNEIAEFLLRAKGSIENLKVEGFVNNLNFTEKHADCVLKTEKSTTIKGSTIIKKLRARNLKVQYINTHSIQDIITDTKNQTLVGSLTVKGSVYVSDTFDSYEKVNNIHLKNIKIDIKKINGTVYKLSGDFLIDNFASINNFIVAGRIQKKDINTLIDNLIYLNDTKIRIPSAKSFNGTVRLSDYIIASKKLNNLDLQSFYINAVLIDKTTYVNSAVVFENDILLANDLSIVDNLKVSTIKGININNFIENAVYFNRPTSMLESVTLSNVVFKSDITVKFWNNTDLEMLLTLKRDEVLQDTLTCGNANVENLTMYGSLNRENLTKVYENTFMISADQRVKGEISFLNSIQIHGDLKSCYTNDIDISKIISLETNDPMIGNFVFDNPVLFNNNVMVIKYLNNINISQWRLDSIISSLSTAGIISGNWTIHNNIDFKKNVGNSRFMNGVDFDSLYNNIRRQNEEVQQFILNETKNIENICENLQDLQNQTDYSLYKFKSFEYLKVLQFDKKIESIHHFEFDSTEYILVNFETCDMNIYTYTDERFSFFANASDFGKVKQYITFNYKNYLYIVTAGKVQCGRNSGNLWTLVNEQFIHIYDFGNVTSIEKLREVTFALVVDHQVQKWSIEDVHQKIFVPLNKWSIEDNKISFFKYGSDVYLASCDKIYRFKTGSSEFDEIKNPFKSIDISSFRVGIQQKEYLILHDDQINSDYMFIYDRNLVEPKELQSLRTHKPNAFTTINFDGQYESLLIFSENKKEIQIYEYKGLEYFKYHSSIQMKMDKLYSFQLRTNSFFANRQCIAIIHDTKLTILEAKMYGEKSNINNHLVCSII